MIRNQRKVFALGRLKAGQMNKGEAQYAAHLRERQIAGEIVWFMFEGWKLRLADNTFYTGDFTVMLFDGRMQVHEVKGRTTAKDSHGFRREKAFVMNDAKLKIKVAAELHPLQFFIVFPRKAGGWEMQEIGAGAGETESAAQMEMLA